MSETDEIDSEYPIECVSCYYLADILVWAANSESMPEEVKAFATNLLDDWSK